MFAWFQVVGSLGFCLLLGGAVDEALVVGSIEGEVLVGQVDLGNDLGVLVYCIIVRHHNGVIARGADLRLGGPVLIVVIVDELLAGPSLVDGKGFGAADCITIDGHLDVLPSVLKVERLALHALASLEDDGYPCTLVLHVEGYLLVVLVAGDHQPREVLGRLVVSVPLLARLVLYLVGVGTAARFLVARPEGEVGMALEVVHG